MIKYKDMILTDKEKFLRNLYLTILVFIVTLFIQSIFIFILRHGWNQDGWKVFVIEDSDIYYPMSDIFEKKGLFYDDKETDESIRSRMPVYPLFILAAKKTALKFGWSVHKFITILNLLLYAGASVFLFLFVSLLSKQNCGLISAILFSFHGPPYSLRICRNLWLLYFGLSHYY